MVSMDYSWWIGKTGTEIGSFRSIVSFSERTQEAKPEEYDTNMPPNDVYDGIWGSFDWSFTLIIHDHLHHSKKHVVVNC